MNSATLSHTGAAIPAAHQLDRQGFVLVPGVLPPDECAALGQQMEAALVQPGGGAQRPAASSGLRELLGQPWCVRLARTIRQSAGLADLLPPSAMAVQCTYFEKNLARNWLVPLHQDLSIPVAHRVRSPALRGWSRKDGTLFVQPPASLLQNLLAVRLHLDPCGADDGPLRVVPGSHTLGVLAPDGAQAVRAAAGEVDCHAGAGTALVMRPLLLHASSKASGASRRRVLHFVFGPAELPWGLRWPETAHC